MSEHPPPRRSDIDAPTGSEPELGDLRTSASKPADLREGRDFGAPSTMGFAREEAEIKQILLPELDQKLQDGLRWFFETLVESARWMRAA